MVKPIIILISFILVLFIHYAFFFIVNAYKFITYFFNKFIINNTFIKLLTLVALTFLKFIEYETNNIITRGFNSINKYTIYYNYTLLKNNL